MKKSWCILWSEKYGTYPSNKGTEAGGFIPLRLNPVKLGMVKKKQNHISVWTLNQLMTHTLGSVTQDYWKKAFDHIRNTGDYYCRQVILQKKLLKKALLIAAT